MIRSTWRARGIARRAAREPADGTGSHGSGSGARLADVRHRIEVLHRTRRHHNLTARESHEYARLLAEEARLLRLDRAPGAAPDRCSYRVVGWGPATTAQCSCGWRSSAFGNAGLAGAAWDRHVVEEHAVAVAAGGDT